MASIRVRPETGLLYFDFQYHKIRCREQTTLQDTPANRLRMQKALDEIEAAIEAGTLKYRDVFPHSRNLTKVEAAEAAYATALTASPLGAIRNAGTPKSASQAQMVDQGPTFAEFAEQYLREKEAEWKRSHRKTKSGIVEQWLLPHFGIRPVKSVTKQDILEFRNILTKSQGKRAGSSMSASRVNHVMTTLKQIVDEAAERFDYVSPYTNIKRVKGKRSDVDPFTLEEVDLIIQSCRADFRNYFVVKFLTGMRPGEIHGLKWEYVDLEKRLILIRETVVDDYEETPKTEQSVRDIQMSPQVHAALVKQFEVSGKTSPFVFSNSVGRNLLNRNVSNRVWYPLLRLLNLKSRTPYQTRHTFATLMLAAGESPEWIANQMGHATTEMLFKVYSRYVPNLTRRDGSAFERMLASNTALGAGHTAGASSANAVQQGTALVLNLTTITAVNESVMPGDPDSFRQQLSQTTVRPVAEADEEKNDGRDVFVDPSSQNMPKVQQTGHWLEIFNRYSDASSVSQPISNRTKN